MVSSEEKIQELQVLEQNLQNFLMQKQVFQVEVAEIMNALEELKSSSDEVYKIVGNIMLKAKKDSLNNELGDKRKILDLRIDSIEKQEKIIEEKISKLKKELNESFNKK